VASHAGLDSDDAGETERVGLEGIEALRTTSPPFAVLWSALLAGLVFLAEANRVGPAESRSVATYLPQALLMSSFLMLACFWDLRWRRIPNWLNASFLLLIAVTCALGVLGDPGPMDRLIGSIAGFGILLAGHSVGMFGAGDVKAAAVLGALWGIGDVINGILCSIVAGGVIAFFVLLVNGRLLSTLSRMVPATLGSLPMFVRIFGSGQAPQADNLATKGKYGVPFACAFALGAFMLGATGFDW